MSKYNRTLIANNAWGERQKSINTDTAFVHVCIKKEAETHQLFQHRETM